MAKIRCKACVGSGKVMGGGMMMNECDVCDGSGKIYDHEASRMQSIKKIQALHDGMSFEEATKLFEEEMQKLNTEDKTEGKADDKRKTRKS